MYSLALEQQVCEAIACYFSLGFYSYNNYIAILLLVDLCNDLYIACFNYLKILSLLVQTCITRFLALKYAVHLEASVLQWCFLVCYFL